MFGNGLIILQLGERSASLFFEFGMQPSNILPSLLEQVRKFNNGNTLEEYIEYFNKVSIVNPSDDIHDQDRGTLFFMNKNQTWNMISDAYAEFPNLPIRALFEKTLVNLPDFKRSLNLEDNQDISNVYVIDLDTKTLQYYVGGTAYGFNREMLESVDFTEIDEDYSELLDTVLTSITAKLNTKYVQIKLGR